MNELLIKLKKAVDRVLDAHASTVEIGLSEFPAYVIKSLETILADDDEQRAASRLALLKRQVDAAVDVIKQSAGAAEDVDSYKIEVVVFTEPGLSAGPKVESESTPIAAGGALGASAVHSPDGVLGKALDSLRQEVDELKRMLGSREDEDSSEEDEKNNAKGKDDEDEKNKAKDKDGKDGDDEKDEVAKSIAWPHDMNETMSDAGSVTKRDATLDWGSDSKEQTEAK